MGSLRYRDGPHRLRRVVRWGQSRRDPPPNHAWKVCPFLSLISSPFCPSFVSFPFLTGMGQSSKERKRVGGCEWVGWRFLCAVGGVCVCVCVCVPRAVRCKHVDTIENPQYVLSSCREYLPPKPVSLRRPPCDAERSATNHCQSVCERRKASHHHHERMIKEAETSLAWQRGQ